MINYYRHFHVPPISDGYWHHVGVSWLLGNYTIFLDGTLVYSGDDLGSNAPLKPGGAFVVGLKLENTDETSRSSFSGKLSQLNIWSEFIPADVAEMKFTNQSCLNRASGNVFTWSSLKDNCNCMVVKEQPSSCKPLRKSKFGKECSAWLHMSLTFTWVYHPLVIAFSIFVIALLFPLNFLLFVDDTESSRSFRFATTIKSSTTTRFFASKICCSRLSIVLQFTRHFSLRTLAPNLVLWKSFQQKIFNK